MRLSHGQLALVIAITPVTDLADIPWVEQAQDTLYHVLVITQMKMGWLRSFPVNSFEVCATTD